MILVLLKAVMYVAVVSVLIGFKYGMRVAASQHCIENVFKFMMY